ncbi:MAG: hypothetical protein ACTSV2_05210, partial [Candidatus Thorarchaeota archaeon]
MMNYKKCGSGPESSPNFVLPECFNLQIFLYDLISLCYMKSADETTMLLMLLQIPGPAPDLILISLFFWLLVYLLVWRIDRRTQIFGIESSRSRRPRFIAS